MTLMHDLPSGITKGLHTQAGVFEGSSAECGKCAERATLLPGMGAVRVHTTRVSVRRLDGAGK